MQAQQHRQQQVRLYDLPQLARVQLAAALVVHPAWRQIGLNWQISYEQLVAMHTADMYVHGQVYLVERLIENLAQRNVTVGELAAAFVTAGLPQLADQLLAAAAGAQKQQLL